MMLRETVHCKLSSLRISLFTKNINFCVVFDLCVSCKLVNGAAAARLRARPKLEKTFFIASSGEDTAEITQKFAEVLGRNAPLASAGIT